MCVCLTDSVRFNVCDVLKKQDGAEGDQVLGFNQPWYFNRLLMHCHS